MTREEFSQLLKEAGRMSGKTTVELISTMQITGPSIFALYQNKTDATMSKVVRFLNAISFHIAIIENTTKNEKTFYNYEDIREFIRYYLAMNDASYREIATQYDISVGSAYRILNSSVAIRLSFFLKILELNNYSLRLDAN